MSDEKSVDGPFYDSEECGECGESASNMEWEDDYWVCPSCGEVQ